MPLNPLPVAACPWNSPTRSQTPKRPSPTSAPRAGSVLRGSAAPVAAAPEPAAADVADNPEVATKLELAAAYAAFAAGREPALPPLQIQYAD